MQINYDKIKAKRKELKLSMQALADKIGLTKMAICHWEKYHIPIKSENLMKLSEALDLTPYDLFDSNYITHKVKDCVVVHKPDKHCRYCNGHS